MKLHALSIPEVVESIVKYLPSQDQVVFLRLSKIFHSVLSPIVWRKISIRPRSRFWPHNDYYPTGSSLQRYKYHIRDLEFDSLYPPEYLNLQGCRRLRKLRIVYFQRRSYTTIQEPPKDHIFECFSNLIAAHASTLEYIGISLPGSTITQLWDAIAGCPKMNELYFKRVSIPNECISSLIQVCGNGPRSLTFSSMEIPEWQVAIPTLQDSEDKLEEFSHPDYGFFMPGPRILHINACYSANPLEGASYHSQAMLVRSCINLETLSWLGHPLSYSDRILENQEALDEDASLFCNTLSMDPWPLHRLESLNLSWAPMKDIDLARLLNQMNQLKDLMLSSTSFGQLSFDVLLKDKGIAARGTSGSEATPQRQRLCDSVETLDLCRCENVTSMMLLALLSNCRNLKTFTADMITAQDISRGKEWVCDKLETLKVHIAVYESSGSTRMHSSADMERAVYSRLSKLVKLKQLAITNPSPRTDLRTIDLKLGSGLELLKDLKELQYLFFN